MVCSANPRLVDGKPSKNPRYLQTRPDLVDPMAAYVMQTGDAAVPRVAARRSRFVIR